MLGVPGIPRNARSRRIFGRRPERRVAQRVVIAWNRRRLALRDVSLRSGKSLGRHHVAGKRYSGTVVLAIQFGKSTAFNRRLYVQAEARSRLYDLLSTQGYRLCHERSHPFLISETVYDRHISASACLSIEAGNGLPSNRGACSGAVWCAAVRFKLRSRSR